MKRKLIVVWLMLSLVFIGFINGEEFSIVAVGDIMLGRYIGEDLSRRGYIHPYTEVKDIISSADIAFANLECPISLKGKPEDKKYCFRAHPKVIKGLKYAGFDILSLANNHTMDYGKIALQDTIGLLRKNGILSVGAGKKLKQARRPAIMKIKGIKTVFLAYNCTHPKTYNAQKNRPGVCPGKIGIIREDIDKARESANLIIVSFHWGHEYDEEPTSSQKKLAHETIDAGADLVIGHHPHVLQGVEVYKEKLIFYSLGNFIFDQTLGDINKAIIIKCFFRDKKLLRVTCIPIIRSYERYYPRIAPGGEKREIELRLLEISKYLNSNAENLNWLYFE